MGHQLLESAESPERGIPECEQVCDFCLQTAQANRRGEPEKLLICRDCGNKAHPSCMNYTPELVHRIYTPDASAWQCIDCKACIICNDSGDPSSLLFCDACDKGYHMQCHVPPLATMPIGMWVCYNCQNHPISPGRLSDSGGYGTVMNSDGGGNLMMRDDLPLQCEEEIRGECTVEVKDIHIQALQNQDEGRDDESTKEKKGGYEAEGDDSGSEKRKGEQESSGQKDPERKSNEENNDKEAQLLGREKQEASEGQKQNSGKDDINKGGDKKGRRAQTKRKRRTTEVEKLTDNLSHLYQNQPNKRKRTTNQK